jgi:hypothetical protein
LDFNFQKNIHALAVIPKNEKTGGDKPRPYGFRGISVASVGAGFTPARSFQKKNVLIEPNRRRPAIGVRHISIQSLFLP